MEKVDHVKQDEYIAKNMEYSMFNIVQSCMYDKTFKEIQSRQLIKKLMKGKNPETWIT